MIAMVRPASSKGREHGMRRVELVDAHYRREDVEYGASFIWDTSCLSVSVVRGNH